MATNLVMGSRVDRVAAAGRQPVRRLFLCALLVAWAGRMPQAAPELEPQVTVNESAGYYQVAATFGVAAVPAVAIAVLTDFESIPTFMPDMKSSVVLERTDAGALVEQEAVARFMLFSKKLHLALRVNERNGIIHFRDESGKSFVRYEGLWKVGGGVGHTTVEYQLGAKPHFDVPPMVLKRLMKRDATQMIARLQAEIERRAATFIPPSQ